MAARTTKAEKIAEEMGAGCLALRVRLLSRTITGIYNAELGVLGLTASQATILAMIARRGPISPGVVARLLNIEKSTMSRTVERMRKQGWIAIQAAASGNQQELTLRPKGRALLEKAAPFWRTAQKKAAALLGRQGTNAVHQAADAVWDVGESQ